MHESSLGKEVLRLALARADDEGAARVRAVQGWVAETEQLDPEAITFHFAAHARGTKAEGARLELVLLRVEAECHACRKTYRPERHLLLCPRCGSTEATLLGPTGLGIDCMVVD